MKERGRTLDSVTKQYINDVRPAYFKHIESIKEIADIVIVNNISKEQFIKDTEKILSLL